jgi:hypothetical protein
MALTFTNLLLSRYLWPRGRSVSLFLIAGLSGLMKTSGVSVSGSGGYWLGSRSASARRLGFAVAGTHPVQAVEQGAHLRGHPIAVPSCRPNSALAERHRDGIRSRYAARLYLGDNRSKRNSPRIRASRAYLSGAFAYLRSRPRSHCHRPTRTSTGS